MKISPLIATLFMLAQLMFAQAQAAVASTPTTPANIADPILLWPKGAPGATGKSDEDKPAIIPFIPEPAQRNGAAVLVIPGGAFTLRVVDHEGVNIAQWFKARGVAAFVLRYRLLPLYGKNDWARDGQRALQYIRAHADEFGISPNRVGTIGFSAGGAVITDMAFNPAVVKADAKDPLDRISAKPDFMVLVYGGDPVPPSVDPAIVSALPPTFMFCTAEDSSHMDTMLPLYTSLFKAKVPVEAHFFSDGQHGAGFALGDPTLGKWPELMHQWLLGQKLLTDKPRFALNGLVKLDGAPLVRGMVILTPIDDPFAPPAVSYVLNLGTGEMGVFSLPKNQGPVAGKYRVEVRQDATRWTSNSRDPVMIKMMTKQREKTLTDADRKEWGEYLRKRDLSPSIENQRVFPRQRPQDSQDYIVEIKDDSKLMLEVFSR